MEIELEIFSGLPNPSWSLSDQERAELARRLSALERMPADLPEPPGLGYRGFRICEAGAPVPTTVYRGVVRRGDEVWHDPAEYALERWLLETAGERIDSTLRRYVLEELGTGR